MDWWRAKVWLIVAFALLDGFLGWQVARLHVARAVGQAPRALGGGFRGAGSAGALPLLAVTTWRWQPSTLGLLAEPHCSVDAAARQVATSFQCTGADGERLFWYDGLAVYTRPGPGHGLTTAAGAQLVTRLMAHLNPDPLAPGAGGQLVVGANGQFQVFETYDGHPLFNGNWTVTLTPRRVIAQGWWLQVVQTLSAPRTAISAARARADLVALYGPGTTEVVGTRPFLGYYSPTKEAPGGLWYLAPVWRLTARFDCGRQESVYVDAFTGGSAVPNSSPCAKPQGGS